MTSKNNPLVEFLLKADGLSIPYVIWKNTHEVDKCLDKKSDLDIFVPEDFKKDFLRLAQESFWIKVSNPVAIFADIEHLFLVDSCGTSPFHLHVYFGIVTGESWIKEFHLPLDKLLMESRTKGAHGLYILKDKARAYLFALRHIAKCGSIASRVLYLKEIESYKLEWELCNYSIDKLRGYGPILLDDVICNSGLVNGFHLSGFINSVTFRSELSPFLRIRRLLLPFYRLTSFTTRVINKLFIKSKKVLRPKGLVVAISGVDGSGKSSMVESVNLCLSEFLTIKRLSLGKPQGRIVEFFRKLLSGKGPKAKSTIGSGAPAKTGMLKSASLLVLACLRFVAAWKSQYYVSRGYVVLADRWPTRVFGKMDGPKIYSDNKASAVVKLLSELEKQIYEAIPAADVCFFLEVSVDTAIERNALRVKENKETEGEIRDRHAQNQKVVPVAKKLIAFDNNGGFKEKEEELLLLVRDELVQYGG